MNKDLLKDEGKAIGGTLGTIGNVTGSIAKGFGGGIK